MKILILLSLVIFASCKGGAGSGDTTAASVAASPTNSNVANNNWSSRTDSTVQNIVYDVVNGGSSYYSSTNILADSTVFTIPSTVTLTNNTTNSVLAADYIELQMVNRILCTYNRSGNVFNFSSCTSYASSVYWNIQAGDSYQVTDLNADSPALDKNKIIFVLQSNTNAVMNGHITFTYDL